jgi:antitoxin component HigA of HigAB toxin-antitoxin module
MMDAKILKTDAEHQVYLAEVERLAALDPGLGTPEGDRLELLAKLVEDSEGVRRRCARSGLCRVARRREACG